MHSNKLKRDGFFHLGKIASVPNSVISQMIAHGGDRHEIIQRISVYSGKQYTEMLSVYNCFLMEGFESVEKRSGADELFALAVDLQISLRVLSATPQCYLDDVVRMFFSDVNFDAVVGGVDKGTCIRNFLIGEDIDSRDVLMVGDGQDDCEAARFAGCQFVGVEGGTLHSNNELVHPRVKCLGYIIDLIGNENRN